MTWYYTIDTETLVVEIWDHTAAAGDAPLATVELSAPRDRTDEQVLKDVMADEIDAAVDAGNIDRAVKIARDGSTDQIERGAP